MPFRTDETRRTLFSTASRKAPDQDVAGDAARADALGRSTRAVAPVV
jgi:hypothetical protein